MPNVKVTSFLVDGIVTEQIIALEDNNRRYIAIQSQDSAGKLGIGEPNLSTAYVEMADGDIWSAAVNIQSKFRWIGTGLDCVVFQDADSNVLLSSDKLMLTYATEPIYYNRTHAYNLNTYLSAPVFS